MTTQFTAGKLRLRDSVTIQAGPRSAQPGPAPVGLPPGHELLGPPSSEIMADEPCGPQPGAGTGEQNPHVATWWACGPPCGEGTGPQAQKPAC